MRIGCFIFLGVVAAGIAVAQEAPVPGPDGAEEVASTNQLSAADVATALQSERVTLLLDAAKIYIAEGEHDAAERAFLKALDEEPENPNARSALSTLYILTGRQTEAIDLLTALAEEFPGNPLIHNNLSWAYSAPGGSRDGKKALFHAQEAVLISPNSASMWNTLAEAYYISGRYDKALRVSEHAMGLLRETNPDEATREEYSAQYQKIKRAQEVMEIFEGKDD